jgi:hypothetical protein
LVFGRSWVKLLFVVFQNHTNFIDSMLNAFYSKYLFGKPWKTLYLGSHDECSNEDKGSIPPT